MKGVEQSVASGNHYVEI